MNKGNINVFIEAQRVSYEACKKRMSETYKEGLTAVVSYLRSALKEAGLDGQIKKNGERIAGHFNVLDEGSVIYVKVKKNGMRTEEIWYSSSDYLRYDTQVTPEQFIRRVMGSFKAVE